MRGAAKLPPANRNANTEDSPPGEPDHTSSQPIREPHSTSAAGANFPDSQCSRVPHIPLAVGDATSTDSHMSNVNHCCVAVRGPILADPFLGMAADVVGDLEIVRIANQNRLRTLTATDETGHGLTVDHPDVAQLAAIVGAMKNAEEQAVKNLQKVMKLHPLGPWVQAHKGVGEKQAARLLAVIRDPYWNDLHDRPRTVSELRSYCGLGDAKQQIRRRGQKSNWSDDARKRVWLICDKVIQANCGKNSAKPNRCVYAVIYDEAREAYAEAVHTDDCFRCGPKGKPALPGSPLSAGHQKGRAMRLMSKAILKDLWIEAKRIHEEQA